MSFAAVRAVIESKVWDQFQAMSPAVPVVFDNVQETPPALPYVMCLVSYNTTTEPVICPGGGAVERLLGQPAAVLLCPTGKGHEGT